ncbi:hypothetical protein FOA52_001850 [Chlamydomonas sp. UWO 241]|nr:hypothetical protein FOA52_001850 [Chlamydomonas sp. UWO 241]
MTRPREEWRLDAGARYRSLERLSKEDARLQFLRILRSLPYGNSIFFTFLRILWSLPYGNSIFFTFLRILRSLPYGNSIFFTVRRIEDPIGLLPAKLILGVNKRGVHFFRPVPKEYLHSAELRDIMQFGSSSTAVFFKMRVAGVLHIFQFETRQGEDICMALQTHINDIMMKRYSKAKAMATGGPESKAAPSNPDALGLQQANYGAKYEEHVAQLQKSLEEAQQRVDQTQRSIHDLTYKHEQYTSELDEVTEQLRAEEAGRNALDATLQALHKELDNTRSEVQLVKAGAAVAATSSPDDDVQLAKLEKELEAVAREFEERGAALLVLEKRAEQLSREKELVDKKVQRIEKSREGEVAELTDKLTISRDTQEQLQSKDSKIAETMAELTHINALFEATREELAGFKADAAELAELREMREDVERKEKQQKAIIEHQSKRLGELGKLFTDEQLTRKRYFNQMEDMKGKLRVAVRVRGPDTGAGSTVTATDPLTLLLQTDGGEPSELGFDAVFGPDASQEDVYEEVKPMVQSAVDGFNACVVVCGQPGAGCSHSLFGTDATPGVAMRAVDTLFRIVTRDASKFTFSVACCMLELHEGTLRDALLPPALKSNPPQLLVKKNTNGVVTVAGVSTVQVVSAAELKQMVASAAELKQMVGAGLSRRHAGAGLMLSVVIESTNLQTLNVFRTLNVFTGRLAFSHAGDTPDAMAALDAVVGPLAAGEARVPYSRSPVTTLLSDAFGGNAKTLVIVPISPDGSDADATRAALRLAEKMRGIKNSSHKTELSKEQARLRKQVDAWKEQAGLSRAEAILAELVDVADAREAAAE